MSFRSSPIQILIAPLLMAFSVASRTAGAAADRALERPGTEAVVAAGAPASALPLFDETPHLAINEFMYAPPRRLGDDDDYEWIELYNYGNSPLDLCGWSVNGVSIAGSVAPHAFFIVARQDLTDPDGDGEYFSAYYNPGNGFVINCEVFDAQGADLSLDNHEGRVELRNAAGDLVDAVDYSRHNDGGATLERGCPFAPTEHSKWDPCKLERAMGTPDYQNTRLLVTTQLDLTDASEANRLLGYSVLFRNNSALRGRLTAWFVLTDLESGERYTSAALPLFLGPNEEKRFTGTYLLPASITPGAYRLTLIHGVDDNHSLAPENEEFSLLSSR